MRRTRTSRPSSWESLEAGLFAPWLWLCGEKGSEEMNLDSSLKDLDAEIDCAAVATLGTYGHQPCLGRDCPTPLDVAA